MKEVTEWDNNPREMWVWNDDEKKREKCKVIYILNDEEQKVFKKSLPDHDVFPVLALDNDNWSIKCRHCAELKPRRMTNGELADWLSEPHRQFINKVIINGAACNGGLFCYDEEKENDKCPDDILIRENGGEWHEPLVED